MILKAVFLLLNSFALLFSGSNAEFCTDGSSQSIEISVESQDSDLVEVSPLNLDLYIAHSHSKAILSENTLEEEHTEVSLLVPRILTFFFYNRSVSLGMIERKEFTTQEILERNFIPFPHASRNILFHTLQINC